LDLNNYNIVYLRDKRYDVVLHLVTAADGAEKFYTLENNAARYEDVPTAIKVD
jgi:Tfp pilus assembly protein PilE